MKDPPKTSHPTHSGVNKACSLVNSSGSKGASCGPIDQIFTLGSRESPGLSDFPKVIQVHTGTSSKSWLKCHLLVRIPWAQWSPLPSHKASTLPAGTILFPISIILFISLVFWLLVMSAPLQHKLRKVRALWLLIGLRSLQQDGHKVGTPKILLDAEKSGRDLTSPVSPFNFHPNIWWVNYSWKVSEWP